MIEDANGRIRLVSSAAAGGDMALEGAKSVGVPYTRRGEDVRQLRDYIRTRTKGSLGLHWVAVGEMSPAHDKCPYIVVGFYYQEPDGVPAATVGLSRSALKDALSSKEADRMITEAIGFDPDVCLEDALSGLSGLSLKPKRYRAQRGLLGLPAAGDPVSSMSQQFAHGNPQNGQQLNIEQPLDMQQFMQQPNILYPFQQPHPFQQPMQNTNMHYPNMQQSGNESDSEY